MATNLQWNNVEDVWNDNPYKWDDIHLISELVSDGASIPEIVGLVEHFEPEKRRRFIFLI